MHVPARRASDSDGGKPVSPARLGLPLGLALLGCRAEPGGKAFDTADCCQSCCTPDCSYSGYEWSDLRVEDDNSSNWIHEATPRVVEVYLDAPSFVGHLYAYTMSGKTNYEPLTEAEIVTAWQERLDYWNAAGADITLNLASSTTDCCNSATDTSCTDCYGDGKVNVFYWSGDSRAVNPDFGSASAGTAPAAAGYCLQEKDLFVFSGTFSTWSGEAGSSSDWCEFRWLYPFGPSNADGGIDDTCADDGAREYLFLNTMVHELGHVLGLGHQPTYSSSIVNESCTGCNQWAVGSVDQTCLTELYDACQ